MTGIWVIRTEQPEDIAGIFDVHRPALVEEEARLVDRLREQEGSGYGPSVVADEVGRIWSFSERRSSAEGDRSTWRLKNDRGYAGRMRRSGAEQTAR